MSLFDLTPSNTISTSQIRLALIARKSEIAKAHQGFPNIFAEEFYRTSVKDIDSFLFYIDGSNTITAIKDTESDFTAIEFTIAELQTKIDGLPLDGYFRREKDQLWYYFICEDKQVVEQKYELLDFCLNGKWMSVASISTFNELNLVGQELRYLVLA
jgi:hypothetical protein